MTQHLDVVPNGGSVLLEAVGASAKLAPRAPGKPSQIQMVREGEDCCELGLGLRAPVTGLLKLHWVRVEGEGEVVSLCTRYLGLTPPVPIAWNYHLIYSLNLYPQTGL